LPGYHPINFPYFLSKTMRSLNLIDFKEMKVHVLCETKDMPVDCYSYKKMCLTNSVDGRLKVIFITSDASMENTVCEEIILGRYFIRALSSAISGTTE